MTQFYAPYVTSQHKLIEINNKEEIIHIAKSHRAKIGDRIKVFNGKGWVFYTEIKEISKTKIVLEVIEKQYIPPKNYNLILFQAIIKPDKFELVLQKTTELGVNEITPVKLERSEYDVQLYIKKYKRFENIILEASKQSETAYIPLLNTPLNNIDKLFEQNENYLNIVSYKNTSDTLSKYIDEIKNTNTIRLIVGPEGDFSPKELDFLKTQKNTIFVKISENILRSETSSILLVGLVSQLKEYF